MSTTPIYPQAIRRSNWAKHGERPSPLDWGALGNFRQVFDGQTTIGSATLTCPSAPFKPNRVNDLKATISEVGKLVWLDQGNGTFFSATIAAYVSADQVTLSAQAPATITGAWVVWGTDDTVAWQDAIDQTALKGGILDGAGRNYFVSRLFLTSDIQIRDASFYLIPHTPALSTAAVWIEPRSEDLANWSAGLVVLGLLTLPSEVSHYAPPLLPTERLGKKFGITLKNVSIDGLRHFNTGMSVTVGQGARSGLTLLGFVSDFLAKDCSFNYCPTDGVQIFSSSAINKTSDADADLTFQRVQFVNCEMAYNRRQGVSADSLFGVKFRHCEGHDDGLDVASRATGVVGMTEGDLGDRVPEIYPGAGFIPAGTPTTGTPGYQYGRGIDIEGYGVGSCVHDVLIEECRCYHNATYGLAFQDEPDNTIADTGFLQRRGIRIKGGYYTPGVNNTAQDAFGIVVFGGRPEINTTVTAAAAAGATTVTLASVAKLVAGDKIHSDTTGEVLYVASIAGSVVTLVYPVGLAIASSAAVHFFNSAKLPVYANVLIDGPTVAGGIQADAVHGLTLKNVTTEQWPGATTGWLVAFNCSNISHDGTQAYPTVLTSYLENCDNGLPVSVQQYTRNSDAASRTTGAPQSINQPTRETYSGLYESVQAASDSAAPTLAVGYRSFSQRTFDIVLAAQYFIDSALPGCFSIGMSDFNGTGYLEERGGPFNTGKPQAQINGVRLMRGNSNDGFEVLVEADDAFKVFAATSGTSPILKLMAYISGYQLLLARYPNTDPTKPAVQIGTEGGASETYELAIGVGYLTWPGALTIGQGINNAESMLNLNGGGPKSGGSNGARIRRGNSIDGFDTIAQFDDQVSFDGHPIMFDRANKVGIYYGTGDPNSGVVMGGITWQYIGAGSIYCRRYGGSGAPVVLYIKQYPSQTGDWLALIGPRAISPSGNSTIELSANDNSNTTGVGQGILNAYDSGGGRTSTEMHVQLDGATFIKLSANRDGDETSTRIELLQAIHLPQLETPRPGVLKLSAAPGHIGAGTIDITDANYVTVGAMNELEMVQVHLGKLRGRAFADLATDLGPSLASNATLQAAIAAALLANTAFTGVIASDTGSSLLADTTGFMASIIAAVVASSGFTAALISATNNFVTHGSYGLSGTADLGTGAVSGSVSL